MILVFFLLYFFSSHKRTCFWHFLMTTTLLQRLNTKRVNLIFFFIYHLKVQYLHCKTALHWPEANLRWIYNLKQSLFMIIHRHGYIMQYSRIDCTKVPNTRTHRRTDRRTFWLIESIGPKGQCFEKCCTIFIVSFQLLFTSYTYGQFNL